MLKIVELNKSYGKKKVFKDLNLHIKKGEVVGILGKNGMGKTTLFECITTISKLDDGDILIDGISIKKDPYRSKNKVGICFQDAIFDRFFNALEILIFTGEYRGLSYKDSKDEALKILKKVGLEEKKERMSFDMSGGERKRLQLAQAIIGDPDLILLDEPTAGLDLEFQKCMFEILDELKNRGKTIVLVTHYLTEIVRIASRVIFFKEGKVTYDMKLDSTTNEKRLLELYEVYC